jgi:uncharacterized protein
VNQQLENIVELQSTLVHLQEAEARLHGIPDWMRELHEEHQARKTEIEDQEKAAEEAARERREAEAAVADAQETLKKFQQQINKVTNQREYGAVLQEIDTAKSQIKEFEEKVFASLEGSETHQKQLEAARESFRELDERYAAELARWEQEKPGVARQVAELRERVASLKQKVPRGLLSQFERLLARYPSGALAPVRAFALPGRQREWHCGVCNYRVRPQTVVEVHNGTGLAQCDACKRILYLEPEEPVP